MTELENIEARLGTYDWDFVHQYKHQIQSCWQNRLSEKPQLFNGKILLQYSSDIHNHILKAQYFVTDYANLIAQQALQLPPRNVRNGFTMAALHTNDGAFLLGEMASRTHNAGRIYFPSGTPDMSDILPDGTVDLAGSVLRELAEETGLTPGEVKPASNWTMVASPMETAFMKPIFVDLSAEKARDMILLRIKMQVKPELSDIHIINRHSGFDHLPDFMQAYLKLKLLE